MSKKRKSAIRIYSQLAKEYRKGKLTAEEIAEKYDIDSGTVIDAAQKFLSSDELNRIRKLRRIKGIEKHKNPYWVDSYTLKTQANWSINLKNLVKTKGWMTRQNIDKVITPSAELTECFGAFYGDGSLKNKLELTCFDESVNERISELMYKIFGAKPWIGRTKWGNTLGYGIAIMRLFSNIGLPSNKSKSNELLPVWITEGSLSIKRAFIRGYFSTDGHCGRYKSNGIEKTPRIHLFFHKHNPIIRKKLAEQIVKILKDLGIKSRVYFLKNRPGVLIAISSKEVFKFRPIGFISKAKQATFMRIIEKYKSRNGVTKEKILRLYQDNPLSVSQLSRILKKHPSTIRQHLKELVKQGAISSIKPLFPLCEQG